MLALYWVKKKKKLTVNRDPIMSSAPRDEVFKRELIISVLLSLFFFFLHTFHFQAEPEPRANQVQYRSGFLFNICIKYLTLTGESKEQVDHKNRNSRVLSKMKHPVETPVTLPTSWKGCSRRARRTLDAATRRPASPPPPPLLPLVGGWGG